jgi:hypothetical protein
MRRIEAVAIGPDPSRLKAAVHASALIMVSALSGLPCFISFTLAIAFS